MKKYAQKYTNLKVIDCKTNGGESKARNIGLDNATGEYLAFLDNDDSVDLDFYEKLYTLANTKNLDIAKADCFEISIDGKKIKQDDNAQIKNNDKFAFVTHWWTAIYKREIILKNNIKFREDIILGGDIIFLNEVLLNSKTFEIIDNTYYYHYQQKNSGDSENLSFDKIASAIKSYSIIIKNLKTNYPQNVSEIGFNYAIKYYLYAIYTKFERNHSIPVIQVCVNMLFDLLDILKDIFNIENLLDLCPQVIYFYMKNDKDGLENFMLKNKKINPLQFVMYKHKLKLLKENH